MILDDIETAPRERLEALQLKRLRHTVDRLATAVPSSRERLRAADALAVHFRLALANQHERNVRHLGKVRDADRTPAGHVRTESAVQRVDERAKYGKGNA